MPVLHLPYGSGIVGKHPPISQHLWAVDDSGLRCVATNPTAVLWRRIIDCSGEVFRQQRGKPFTYSVSGDTVYLDSAIRDLSRRDINEAHTRMPLAEPDDIRDLNGHRYIYAILTDRRIIGGQPPTAAPMRGL